VREKQTQPRIRPYISRVGDTEQLTFCTIILPLLEHSLRFRTWDVSCVDCGSWDTHGFTQSDCFLSFGLDLAALQTNFLLWSCCMLGLPSVVMLSDRLCFGRGEKDSDGIEMHVVDLIGLFIAWAWS